MHAQRPHAAATIRADPFVAVGSDGEALAHRGEATQVIGLGGRTVVPGLNDSHTHVIRGGLVYNAELRWDGVPSLVDGLLLEQEQAARPTVGARCRRLERVPVPRAPATRP